MLKKNENKNFSTGTFPDAMFNESLMGLCSYVFIVKNQFIPIVNKKLKQKFALSWKEANKILGLEVFGSNPAAPPRLWYCHVHLSCPTPGSTPTPWITTRWRTSTSRSIPSGSTWVYIRVCNKYSILTINLDKSGKFENSVELMQLVTRAWIRHKVGWIQLVRYPHFSAMC